MTIEKLQRVMWRLRKTNPGVQKPTNQELRKAIMWEVGTDPRTYTKTKKSLIQLGWIKTNGNKRIRITDRDLTEA